MPPHEDGALLCGAELGALELGVLLCDDGMLLCREELGVLEAGVLLREAGLLLCGAELGVLEWGVLLVGDERLEDELLPPLPQPKPGTGQCPAL
jgi:hypothetical protein